MVVLDGRVAVVGGDGGEQHLVGVHGPGRFLGELGLLSGQGRSWPQWCWNGEVLVVPPERVRELFSRHPGLGDLVLRSYLLRRSRDRGRGEMGIVGSRSVTDTRRLRGSPCAIGCGSAGSTQTTGGPRRRCANSASRRSRPWWCCARPARASQPEQHRAGPHDRAAGAELGETVCDLVLVGVGTGELAAVVDAATDGLAAVALPRSRPSCCRAACSGSRAIPGSPAGISEAELAERAAVQAGTLAAHEVQLAGGTVTGGVVTLADGGAIAARSQAALALSGWPPPSG